MFSQCTNIDCDTSDSLESNQNHGLVHEVLVVEKGLEEVPGPCSGDSDTRVVSVTRHVRGARNRRQSLHMSQSNVEVISYMNICGQCQYLVSY